MLNNTEAEWTRHSYDGQTGGGGFRRTSVLFCLQTRFPNLDGNLHFVIDGINSIRNYYIEETCSNIYYFICCAALELVKQPVKFFITNIHLFLFLFHALCSQVPDDTWVSCI